LIANIDKSKTEEFLERLKDGHPDLKDFRLDLSHLEPGQIVVEVDPRYFRPTEVDILLGDASKAREKLGWEPEVTFDQLIDIMVEYDFGLAVKEKHRNEIIKEG
jgi:GDPmannose 4,6-dehydratase